MARGYDRGMSVSGCPRSAHDEDSEQKRSQKTERAMFHQLLIDRARLVLE